MIATKIYWGFEFEIGNFYDLFRLLLVQYLLHLGYSCIIVCVCILTKSSAFTMTFGILVSCNVMNIIYNLVNKLIHSIGNNISDFDMRCFMLDYNISTYNLQVPANDTCRTVAVGLISIVISVICASIISEKRDVM